MPANTPPATHANGLRLALPAGFKATPMADGFVVEPDPPLDLRSPIAVQVALLNEALTPADAATRDVAPGVAYRWQLQRSEGVGSGGDEYKLSACRAVGAKWLCLRQARQSKGGEPAFELWAVAAGASVAP